MTRAPASTLRWLALLLAALAPLAWWLHADQARLYPLVFADEWYYSSMARLLPPGEAILPSWLYLATFGLTNACGDAFLSCARLGNLLFLLASAPFIFLLARRVCAAPLAFVVTLAAVLAPARSYTLYFMPETMYFFGFYVLSWVVLNRARWPHLAHAATGGALLGLMALVKVHALFLAPALCVFLAAASRARGRRGMAGAALAALAALLAVKLALGYLLAGAPALSLLGTFYSGHASDTVGAFAKLRAMLAPGLVNLRGHALALAAVMTLPLAVVAHLACSACARRAATPAVRALFLYTLLMLGSMAAVTVLYTASIAIYGPDEVLRLHLRYYSFVFPLLLMLAAAQAEVRGAPAPRRAAAVACALLVALAAAVWLLPLKYKLIVVDAPELTMLGLDTARGRALLAFGGLLLLLWIWRRRAAALLYVCAFLPAGVLVTQPGHDALRDGMRAPNPFDTAGQAAHAFLPPAQRADVAIAGDELGNLMRAQFHLDDAGAERVLLAPGAPLQAYQTGRKPWLLVVGEHALPAGAETVRRGPGYTLARIAPAHRRIGMIDLADPLAGGLLAGFDGLSYAQPPFGRWSTGGQVRLRFRAPLPARLSVYLKAQAFGPNAGQDFVLRAGGAQTRFRLPGIMQEVVLRLDTDGRQDTLLIDVPRPASPKALGYSGDARLLGIDMLTLEIGERTGP